MPAAMPADPVGNPNSIMVDILLYYVILLLQSTTVKYCMQQYQQPMPVIPQQSATPGDHSENVRILHELRLLTVQVESQARRLRQLELQLAEANELVNKLRR
jgi:hypothetical protein